MRRSGMLAVVAALSLLASACGSRLSEQERAQAISAITGGSSGTGTGTGATGTGSTGVGTDTGSTGPGTDTGTGGGTTADGSTAGGADTASGGGGAGQAASGACAKATTGGAPGVTPTKLTIATLADVSGVQPGLFQSAHQAVRGAAAYINSTGGICGRQVEPLILDSKTDSGGNRAAMLEACDKAFAVAGSTSAFDDGSAAPGQSCGIPDISAITTNGAKYRATNVFPAYPNAGPKIANTPPKYIAKRYPDVVKKAAILWLNQAVTKSNAVAREKVWRDAGFDFIYEAEVQVLEANFTRFVSEMESRDVQYVTMVSDFQNIVRLQKTMRQQNYVPKVRDWDSVVYDSDYLAEKDAVEGSFVFLNTALIEEASRVPEMKLYTEWLQRASPGAKPDFFGLYAWSAFRLMEQTAIKVGPNLTREKFMAALKATKTWDGHGIHGPHQTGAKQPTTCNIYAEVKGGRFQRMAPASGFDCSGSLSAA
ncbi:MAG: ABC transporter substrate-binding protein [Actinomycetota bacterium]